MAGNRRGFIQKLTGGVVVAGVAGEKVANAMLQEVDHRADHRRLVLAELAGEREKERLERERLAKFAVKRPTEELKFADNNMYSNAVYMGCAVTIAYLTPPELQRQVFLSGGRTQRQVEKVFADRKSGKVRK